MAKIKMSKIAYGSLSTSIGDGTLGYTSGVSDRAREVDGRYVDIPPVLSTEYSTLIWRYYKDTDNYMLTHVQGSQVEDAAMGRVFSYRGAYEVSRSEMNRTGWSVANVLNSMPQIRLYAQNEIWPDEVDYVKHKNRGSADIVSALRQLISYAIDSGKRLYIGIPTVGRNLRCNGVLDSLEWSTLLEAVDSLDLGMRRYVSFAFCADENYADHLEEVLVTVYPRESKFAVPEGGINCQWAQLKPIPSADEKLKDTITVMRTMPGENDKMLTLAEMLSKLQQMKAGLAAARKKSHAEFTPDDYAIWIQDGHTPSDLRVNSWADIDKIMNLVGSDESAKKAIIATHKGTVMTWSANGLTEERIKQFGLQNYLDGAWLLANRGIVGKTPDKWFTTFKNLSLLKKEGVIGAFRQMFASALKSDFSKCSQPEDFFSWVEKYKEIYDASDISNVIATIELKPNKVLLEGLLAQNTRSAVGKIIKAGLNASASRIAKEQGTDLEKWMKLLTSLKDKEGNALLKVRTLCLTQVLEWEQSEKQEFVRNAQRYQSEHPKSAQTDRFRLVVKVLKSIMDKDIKITNQPKSPSNNMQEKTTKANNVAEGIGRDTVDIDSLYEEILQGESKRKNKKTIVFSTAAFVVGLLVSGCAAFFLCPKAPKVADVGAASNSVEVIQRDSEQHIMAQLADISPEGKTVFVKVGDDKLVKVDWASMDSIFALDTLYTAYAGVSGDTMKVEVCKVDSVGKKIDGSKDTLTIAPGMTLIQQIYQQPYVVENVLFGDTITIDINSRMKKELLSEDELKNARTDNPTYYFRLVKWIDAGLKAVKQNIKVAY